MYSKVLRVFFLLFFEKTRWLDTRREQTHNWHEDDIKLIFF